MKHVFLLIFFISKTLCIALDAKSCGAKGDGIQDDAPYLNAAIAKALLLGEDLFIPSGTYKCIQFSYNSKILKMDQSGIKKIKIYGEAGTKITTTQPSGCILFICYQSKDVVIENIFFENTHGITMNQTGAIQLLGTNKNAIQNFSIQNCRFEGFSTAITAQGVRGLVIQNNIFESPKGHDNAQNNSEPAVFIWLADNSNGQCFDVKIVNNQVNGYTGKDILTTTTKRPMDGFVYGTAYGIQIKGNIIRNLSEEYIALQAHHTFINSEDSVLITANKLYQSIPIGSVKEASPLISNYGIRIECNNVSIVDNDFYDYTVGILIYPFQYTALELHNQKIYKNRFYAPKNKSYHVKEAIKIQASPTSPAHDIAIQNNVISIDGIQLKSNRSILSIYDCKNVTIVNNTISEQNIELNGYLLNGILTERCFNVVNKNNSIKD